MAAKKAHRKLDMEVDLQLLIGVIFQKLWLIGVVSVLCAIITFTATHLFVAPTYQSSVMFYVNNSSVDLKENLSINTADIAASKSLAGTYAAILRTQQTLEAIIDYAGVDRTYTEVEEMITVTGVNSTEIISVTVETESPEEAYKIAQSVEYILPSRISKIIEGSSAKVVESAVIRYGRVGPDYTVNAIIGFLLGVFLSVTVIIVRTVLDNRIRSEEDITRTCVHPVLTAVPNMNSRSNGGYYGYGVDKGGIGSRVSDMLKRPDLLGSGISFAASEAYKLLRTKLMLSIADDGGCRIIGISSAMAGEGKSLTSINLAYSLSQMGNRVLLIDCDMRRPSLRDKLSLKMSDGLVNYLTAQKKLEELLQPCGIAGEENAFQVMAAGPNPPNPVELLGSKRMRGLLQILRGEYDYVILDFPPVGEVTDALPVAKSIDGMLLVVRQNYCDRKIFRNVVRQFHYLDAKVLGIVFNCASENTGLYRKYYYKYHTSKYENSYENNIRRSRKATAKKQQKRK